MGLPKEVCFYCERRREKYGRYQKSLPRGLNTHGCVNGIKSKYFLNQIYCPRGLQLSHGQLLINLSDLTFTHYAIYQLTVLITDMMKSSLEESLTCWR